MFPQIKKIAEVNREYTQQIKIQDAQLNLNFTF